MTRAIGSGMLLEYSVRYRHLWTVRVNVASVPDALLQRVMDYISERLCNVLITQCL